MIQRLQSVYLLLAALLNGGLIWYVKLWVNSEHLDYYVIDSFSGESMTLKIMSSLFFIAALLSFWTIFLFKNRQLQFVMGRLIILTNFIILGILVYFTLNLSGETVVSEKGIGLLIPILSVVFVVLANKAIKKDEELVKSVDRLR